MSEITDLKSLHDRADMFSKHYADASYESGQAQNFMRGLGEVYGISSHRAILFEDRVEKEGEKGGINRIDGLFPGLLLIEMKSKGKNLDKAYVQAKGYIEKLKKRQDDQPRYVLVSDFQNLVLYDQESNDIETPIAQFKLADFRQNVEALGFLNGYERIAILRQETVNTIAAEKLADLHDAIKANDYSGEDLERLLVRILFCLFGDDTYLFGDADLFLKLIEQTRADGRDVGSTLDVFFEVLDTPQDLRKNIYPEFVPFPYVNGALFKGRIAPHHFTSEARTALLECCKIDWSEISPAIFGTLFQAIMHFEDEKATGKTKKRREFGAHYTSETNILKVISPLFLDALKEELEKARGKKAKLNAFHAKLFSLNFFDPACGCGNFLVIAYREIRLLEAETLRELERLTRQYRDPICDVDQFHGIEIDSTSAQIAVVALWIADHQMNFIVSNNGKPYLRLPLKHRANIVCANALRIDWSEVIPAEKCSFVMGNPPFLGKKEQSLEQKADLAPLFKSIKGSGVLDYVTAWYVKATAYIQTNPNVSVAFVSTNSICQGEQVGLLWSYLLSQRVKIHFAHRTFRWSNEGKGVAAVHCVIIGFGLKEPTNYRLFDYEDNKGEPTEIKSKQINPYLVDAANILIEKRTQPICKVAKINKGSEATDFGYLALSPQERLELLTKEPQAEKWIKRFIGGDELINDMERYCLWMVGLAPNELKAMPKILKRVEQVREARQASGKVRTREWAQFPTLFSENRQPDTNYLAIPKVSSERRAYLPIGFVAKDWIASGSLLVVPNATKYHFGVLQSHMHNAWMRAVCGRLESRYQYSASIVYNNFPWATPDAQQIKAIEEKAQAVLDARTEHKTSTLADLYNPLTMPPNLVKAHNALDKAVDAAYGYKGGKDDAARVAFLFEQYQKLISLPQTPPPKPAIKPSKAAKKQS